MKTRKTISKLLATAAMTVVAIAPSFAQTNLGAACGCPSPVSSRTTVLMSSLPGFVAGELTTGATLTCDKTYILDQKIYVPAGQTLTINPGTVVKGKIAPLVGGVPDPAQATALVIERGGKLMADGSPDCQIVFTAEADNLDGTFPIASKGQWGGVVILGYATNNLTLAANGPFVPGGSGKLAVADGLGTIEGFASSNSKDQYGIQTSAPVNGVFNDNDNSGVLRYVSIRYSGAILAVGAEINALTLGSVGRGTTLEHIEIVSCADDNIEFFGGTVNVKYISGLFGNDDMFDYDLGWSGKCQFLFGMKTDNTANVDADNGFEADSDDNKSNNLPHSHPIVYNATIIGNAKSTLTSDNSALAGINAKELTEGEIYNSIFASFKTGFNMSKALGTRSGTSEAYHNWSATAGNNSQSFKVKCNTFVGNTDAITVDKLASNVSAADLTQFNTTDMNTTVVGNTLPGFSYAFTVNNATNVFSVKNDVVPNPALSVTGCPVAPADGFFRVAAYRGAFDSDPKKNWLSDWSYSQLLGATQGLVSCPTDINGDGITNNIDFLQLLGSFNQSCQ